MNTDYGVLRQESAKEMFVIYEILFAWAWNQLSGPKNPDAITGFWALKSIYLPGNLLILYSIPALSRWLANASFKHISFHS